MAIYKFKNKETKEIIEISMKISELDEFKINNPLLERYIDSTASIQNSISLGRTKPDKNFTERLNQINKNAGNKNGYVSKYGWD